MIKLFSISLMVFGIATGIILSEGQIISYLDYTILYIISLLATAVYQLLQKKIY